MHVEDGYELPIRVTFEEEDNESAFWHMDVAVLPRAGDAVEIASAPKGTRHLVMGVLHQVGNGRHGIRIRIRKINLPALTDRSPLSVVR